MIALKILEDKKHEEIIKKNDYKIKLYENKVRNSQNFKDFSLFGPAGSGKNAVIKEIAAILELPYVVMSCTEDMTSDDLLGRLTPFVSESSRQPIEHKSLEEIISYTEKRYKISSEKFGGMTHKYLSLILELYSKAQEEQRNKIADERKESIRMKLSLLMKVFQMGGFGVIDECNIAPQALLTTLNNAIADSFIVVDTRHTLYRRVNAFLFFTGNIGYNGTRELNQSVKDRLIAFDTPAPTREFLIDILEKEFNKEKNDEIKEMVDFFVNLGDYAKEEELTSANIGTRGLKYLASLYFAGFNIKEAFNKAIKNKFEDEEERELVESFFENSNLSEL